VSGSERCNHEQPDLPILNHREVGAHNDERSAFVVYDGLVYDVTEFLRYHPGGRSILVPALGTDITDTVDSFHDAYVPRLLQSEKHREQYRIRLVARLAHDPSDDLNRAGLFTYQARREYLRPDTMGEELRREVYAYLREARLPIKKPLWECIALLTLFYGMYGLGVYMAFFRGSPLWCLLLGPIATFMSVNVAHTVMHGGFSDSKTLNFLGRTLWDVGGYSSRCWDVEHQSHHQAPHTSIDAQTAGWSIMRFFEHQPYSRVHRYQMFYMWFVFVLYSPNSWVVHTYNTLFKYECVPLKEKVVHVLAKAIGFVLPVMASFWLFGAGTASRNLLLFAVSMSYFTLFTLFIQHEDSYLPENESESWSVRQVTTSATWHTRNFVFEWLFGYFNYHIEHHLFPGLNPSLYPKIQPIVRAICERHRVRYKRISYIELVLSQLSAWRKFASGWARGASGAAPAYVTPSKR
jgi:linoleoyl-CoA desaturase